MNSARRESTYHQLELERKRKEYHFLERRLAKVEHELDDLKDEIAEFEQLYAEQMSGRIAELESLEKELGKVTSDAGTGDAAHSSGEDTRSEAEPEEDARPARIREHAARQQESLKDIYRRVAKTIHPDLSRNENERKRRQKLMADANRAYAEEDYVTLLCILDEWELEQQHDSPPKSELAILEERIVRLSEQIRAMETEILRLRSGDLYRLILQVQQARLHGRDVLAEMAAKLESDILAACQRLNAANRAPVGTGSVFRTVTFPADVSLGTIYIRNRGSRNFLDWRPFGQAVGNVTVPAGKAIRLDLVPGRAAVLDGLHGLSPGDLQSCYMYNVKDSDLVHILRFREMEELYLSGPGVTGEGVIHLLELKHLERLYLYDTSIDDQSLLYLKCLTSARYITLCSDFLSEAGVSRLRNALPSCSIVNLMATK